MILTKFLAQHYKSLDEIALEELQPITLLVGNNATGKSNVVDSLRFIRDCVVDGLDHAIGLRGGIGTIRQYSPTNPYLIRFQASLAQDLTNENGTIESHEASYDLRLMSLRAGNYRVEREEVKWFEDDSILEEIDDGEIISAKTNSIQSHYLLRDENGAITTEEESRKSRSVRPDEIALRNSRFTPGLWNVSTMLGALRFSSLYPNTLRIPSRPDTDRRLKENGENWASVLKAMKSNESGRRRFDVILQLMKRVLPGLIDVRVQSVGGYVVPKFVVRDAPNQKEHDFDPVQLSDGTLRVFGILLALYQLPAPRFLALEEPELTVNPAILAVLAEAFLDVSTKTQLLVTTHSPDIIDYFPPEVIRVVTYARGKTHVSPIKASQIESIKEHLTTAGELLQRGNLHAEEI